MKTLVALLRLGRPPVARVALSVTLGSLTVLAGAGLMAFAGYLISRAAERPPILALGVAVAAVRAFGIARPVARYFERLVSHDLALRVLARMRVEFYRRLQPLVPARTREYRRGDLLARMVGDVDAMQNLFLRGISPPLTAAVVAVVAVGISALLVPAAGAVLAAGLATAGIAVPAAAAGLGRRSREREVETRAELTAELVELLRGAAELVVLGADEDALARVRALDASLTRALRREALAAGLIEGLGALVVGLTVAAVLAVCVSAAAAGSLPRVLIAAVALLAMASFEAAAPLPAAALRLRATLDSGRRLLSIAAREPAVADPAAPANAPRGSAVALHEASFAYGADEGWSLADVDLALAPGRHVALVGRSGAGKSTVAALLVRFIDPNRGSVTLDAVDLRALRQRDVRAAVSLDGQDAYLFTTSIRENVRLANPAAGDADLEAALRRAKIWDWVRALPAGWDTLVGEEGDWVSGGERRRLALARTFLAGAPVVVLDEPAAHLDEATAEELVADAMSAAAGQSVLLITHRAEGLDLVDAIVTLERGRVTGVRGSERPKARPARA